jgi:hypothetical protein
MIKLCVEKYCHNCAFFKADIEEPDGVTFDGNGNVFASDDYIVRCLHESRCKHAVTESKKNENAGN